MNNTHANKCSWFLSSHFIWYFQQQINQAHRYFKLFNTFQISLEHKFMLHVTLHTKNNMTINQHILTFFQCLSNDFQMS